MGEGRQAREHRAGCRGAEEAGGDRRHRWAGPSPLCNISLAYVEADEPEPGTRLWRAGRDVVLRHPGRSGGRGKPRHVL